MFSRAFIPLFLVCLGMVTCQPLDNSNADRHPRLESDTYTGEATIYTVNPGDYGSCGTQLSGSEDFVALSNYFMMSDYQSSYCGKTITLTNTGASYSGIGGVGNSVTVVVQDTCPSCSEDHLDLSEAAWDTLTDSSPFGVTGITWNFVSS